MDADGDLSAVGVEFSGSWQHNFGVLPGVGWTVAAIVSTVEVGGIITVVGIGSAIVVALTQLVRICSDRRDIRRRRAQQAEEFVRWNEATRQAHPEDPSLPAYSRAEVREIVKREWTDRYYSMPLWPKPVLFVLYVVSVLCVVIGQILSNA